jgi:hypothetical protein
MQGVQWGVGYGKSIEITSDNWILDLPPYLPKPLKPIPSTSTVNCLLDEETREWILEIINAFFDQETTAKILHVPVYRHRGRILLASLITSMVYIQ